MCNSYLSSLNTLLQCLRNSLAILSLLIIFGANVQAETLAINTFGAPPLSNEQRTGFHDQLSITAFKRLGLDIIIPRLPAERALINANKGIDDGDLPRISGLESIYNNLIMVPQSIMDYSFVAFTRHKNFKITGWDSLKPYNVGIITGWKILEKNVVGVRSLTKVKNQTQLFTLLQMDRTDVVIYEKWQGLQTARDMGIKDIKILQPPLSKRKMFMYLNKKHEHLVAKIAKTLTEMKEDGTYQKIFDKTLKPLNNNMWLQPEAPQIGKPVK
ncbi:MAG: transporter substrate-binding domain-containing protein [Magnetococcales bacterium]|nr:transporter substrate-binding domain-containing protein [Magnetococcales bacterium]